MGRPRPNENVCGICHNKFTEKKNLYRHKRLVHKIGRTRTGTFQCLRPSCNSNYSTQAAVQSHISDTHPPRPNERKCPTCSICDKTFGKNFSLFKHLRLVHKVNPKTGTLLCPETNCECTFPTRADIRSHLANAHQAPSAVNKTEKIFQSIEDFSTWKTQEEEETKFYFIVHRKAQQVARTDVKKKIYYCNRSGKFQTVGTGQRNLKSQGSCKTGKCCPAAMEAEFHPDGTVKLLYWTRHFGHSNNPAHVRVSDAEQAEIAEECWLPRDEEIMAFPEEVKDLFHNILPTEFKTQITSITKIPGNDGEQAWSCQARVALKNEGEFKRWLRQHEDLSHLTYRVRKTHPSNGRLVKYKTEYRCHHNTYPKSHGVAVPSKKHTNCKARLVVTIKRVPKTSRSKDAYLQEFPCIILIDYNHNHQIHTPEVLRYRDPADKVKSKFLALFVAGASPALALEQHKKDMMEEHGENYSLAAADRSLCPDTQWVHRLYSALFKRDGCGERTMEKMLKSLTKEGEERGEENMNCIATGSNSSTSNVYYCTIPQESNNDEQDIFNFVQVEESSTEAVEQHIKPTDKAISVEEIVQECEDKLISIMEIIMTRVHANPKEFRSAINSAHKNLTELSKSTDSRLISAIQMIGKEL